MEINKTSRIDPALLEGKEPLLREYIKSLPEYDDEIFKIITEGE